MGILHEILGVISNSGFFIRHLAHSEMSSNEVINVFVVLDLARSSPKISLEELVERLKGVDGVLEVSPCGKYGKTVYTLKLFPLRVAGRRAIGLCYPTMCALTQGLEETLGKTAASLVAVHVGTAIGRAWYRLSQGVFSFSSVSDTIEFLRAQMAAIGWGLVEDYKVFGNKIAITIRDPWELEVSQSSEDPVVLRNVIKGFYSELLGRDTEVETVSSERVGGHWFVTVVVRRSG
uniref:ACT domain-containing protein n=1 Tax=Fervidicoccus fontis TaxID=683846 RepID=A0A7J3ZKD7_9CREN